ncbi:MBL fold metallo-hydrolase [Ferrovibrio xuzhouensis]|uniref:MBL fold metallo-hydrolase n=1 Tax=Ferrovibrio xuzhouensis TaxID=1576914 RepID=A0ABV7VBN0_9PROT
MAGRLKARFLALSRAGATVFAVLTGLLVASGPARALEAVRVAENVYALVGPLEQRSASNLGNNATFGVIITADGVVLIDSGGSAKGAVAIEAAVRRLTDKPIRTVINSGGQDHRWFGNDYFRSRGARIIAASAAVADQESRAAQQLQGMTALIGATAMDGTQLAFAERRFEERLELQAGGIKIEIRHPGQAHTPGDSFIWLPEQGIAFAGDIVFMDRLLGIGPQSSSRAWLSAFEAIEALHPVVIVPGHGWPGPLQKAKRETYDYIHDLRNGIGRLLESGADLASAADLDQSGYRHLAVFDELSRRNAQAVYQEMELE